MMKQFGVERVVVQIDNLFRARLDPLADH
jgi:hypothetical protein